MKKINRIFKCNRIRRFGGKVSSFLKKKKIRYSIYVAFFLSIACYFIDNCPVLTGESMTRLYIIDQLFHTSKTNKFDNVVFCNTSYDIDLVPVLDIPESEYSQTLGFNAITNRKELYNFLVLLQKSNTYKYIIIDLAFEKNDKSSYDDILYDKILDMRDIVIANDDYFELTPKLSNKGIDGLDIFYITKANTSFSRYKYSDGDKRSIPLLVFEKLYPEKSIKRVGRGLFSLYFSGQRLCYNSNFLTFDDNYSGEKDYIESLGEEYFAPQYATLKSFLDKPLSENQLVKETASKTNNKIIIIGDYKHDIHDTYSGEKPGPVIMARALQYLINGYNIVNPWHLLFWLFIYFGISYLIFRDEPIPAYLRIIKRKLSKIPFSNGIQIRIPALNHIKIVLFKIINKTFLKNITKKFIYMATSLLTYTAILWLCTGIEYALTYKVYSIIFPLLFFYILKLAVQYRFK